MEETKVHYLPISEEKMRWHRRIQRKMFALCRVRVTLKKFSDDKNCNFYERVIKFRINSMYGKGFFESDPTLDELKWTSKQLGELYKNARKAIKFKGV